MLWLLCVILQLIGSLSGYYRGANAKDSTSGGGAGGSVRINATAAKGLGQVAVTGGDGGATSGGGGSGGFAAIHLKNSTLLLTFTLRGGSGNRNGASGILFVESTNDKDTYSKMVVDNGGLSTVSTSTFLICDPLKGDYTVNEIELLRASSLSMKSCEPGRPMTLIADMITGDKTGWLLVDEYHDVYVGVTTVIVPRLDMKFNARISQGAVLSLPKVLTIGDGMHLLLTGSLLGVNDVLVAGSGELEVQYPGHTGYRRSPSRGKSTLVFRYLRIQKSGQFTTTTPQKVELEVQGLLQVDYGGNLDPDITLNAAKKVVHGAGSPLGRQDCPHGYEVVALASPALYNPCGVGKHVFRMSNISYIVSKNVSRHISKTAFRNVSGFQESYIKWVTVYTIVNETRYNVTYYIACNFTDFVLLPGQSCSLKAGTYNYNSLDIQGDAKMMFEASSDKNHISKLVVSQLAVFSGGSILALTSDFENKVRALPGNGGSYGGHGGGDDDAESIYGRLDSPTEHGAVGGGSPSSRGRGGGALTITSREFINDGLVDASGGSGTGSAGGGSGGSLHIQTGKIEGSGTFSARGGGSSNPGGGGGGGRMSINVTQGQSAFHGVYDATGGGPNGDGSPGTIFVSEHRESRAYYKLILKGKGHTPQILPSGSVNHFHELHLEEGAVLRARSNNLSVKMLITDGSGKLTSASGSQTDILNIWGEKKDIRCDLEIESGATVFLRSRAVFSGPGTPSVLLQGLLDVVDPVVGRSASFNVGPTGQLLTNTFGLEAGALVQVSSNATMVKRLSNKKFQLDSLVMGTGASLRFTGSVVQLRANSIRMDKDATIGFSPESSTKHLTIVADNMVVDSFAGVSVNTGGYIGGGPGVARRAGDGCGHGGQGSGAGGGDAYGSVFQPSHYGSGNGVRGGGVVILNVSQTLTLHGSVSADGANDSRGGSSGGSVLLNAGVLAGHGTIQAMGGEGLHSSHGGSGGRIALYVTDKSLFTGTVLAYGGCGGDCGAAGTVFMREYAVGLPLNTTIVDNGARTTTAKTMIMHEQQVSYTIRRLRLVSGGRLEIASVPGVVMKIHIQLLDGDRTGSLSLHANQTLTLGVGKAVSERPFVFPWAMTVDSGAILNLSPKLFITQTHVTPSLNLAGQLVGGQEIAVGQDALVVVAKTGIIGTQSGTAGKYSFRSLKVSGGGRIRFESDLAEENPVEIRSVSIDVGFGGILEGRFLNVRTPLLNVAFSGTLTADALGNAAGTGPGAGSAALKSGGSYGGCGGGAPVGSCRVYGSLYKAAEFGSGGGTLAGSGSYYGAGGGIIDIEADTAVVDGVISSNGGLANDTLTGGGSGGSINVAITTLLMGRGRFETRGGDGGSQTGSGSGGRISLLITGIYKYDGAYVASGGRSISRGGSPGTVYIYEERAGFRSKKLFLDNSEVSTSASLPVLLNESDEEPYHFNELLLKGKVTLFLEKDMVADKFISNADSTFHIQDNVTLTVEPLSKYLASLCSFHVERDGEIRVPDTATFLGSRNNFGGTLTGVLDMVIGDAKTFEFSPSARTARYIDGKYTFITERGQYRFSSLRVKNNGLLFFGNSKLREVPLTLGKLELNFGAVLRGSWLHIKASDVIIHPGATMDLSGQGHGSENGTGAGERRQAVGTGAGHGGFGGLADDESSVWYGSAYDPKDIGSGGGSSTYGVGGSGGGYVRLQVLRSFLLEGTITADGSAGPSLDSGGGSAGSIWISAKNVQGNGFVTADGGAGNGQGGGGSGGRTALYLQEKMIFEGGIRTRGGGGGGLGASGTVYIQDNGNRIRRERLWVHNPKSGDENPTTVLSEPNKTLFSFDELKLLGRARFEIANLKKQKLAIHVDTFTSDGVGELVLKDNQTMYTEVLEAKESHLTLTTNVYVEEGANLVLASNLTVDGATLTLDGKLSNVRNLIVESGGAVKFGTTSQTALMKGDGFVFLSSPGTQQFASITLKSGSDFGAPEILSINVGRMDMKNGVLLPGKFVNIKAQELIIGRGATISTDSSISDEDASGSTGQSSSSGASGAGHGSAGGSGANNLEAGMPYGTVYTPDQAGRPGGDGASGGTGGNGGGIVRIIADVVLNDGYVTANGGHASGSNGGGGSGGSIFFTISKEFSGTGLLSANGGRGEGAGGCGAGGRVAVHIDSAFSYRGTLQALGGLSKSAGKPGGPGTVYIQELKNKLHYNQLLIDNLDQDWGTYVTLNENSSVYDFNEVHLLRKASLRMAALPKSRVPQELKIRKLFGDKSGLLHIYKDHKVVMEVVEAQRTTTKTPVNLKIESGGEAVMATTVYIVGSGAVALDCNGTLSGILNLYVTQNRVVRLLRGARTSRKDEQAGTFLFSNLKLFSGSELTMEDDVEMRMYVGFVNIKYSSSLSAHHLKMFTSELDVERGGLLSTAGENSARQASPSKEVSALPLGAGAGHASTGGPGSGGSGGTYYGSVLYPVESGRRGGSGPAGRPGGSGGGSIRIESGNKVVNDGAITAAGGSASTGSNGGGGGSGGSILLSTDVFEGE